MKKILVTGSAGYIGSHTVVELKKAGYEVVGADNYSNSSEKTYDRIQSITGGEKIRHFAIDLCEEEAVKKMFGECGEISGIIHFAAHKSVPESVQQPLNYYHNNLYSLVNLLTQAKKNNVPYFIFSSSCSVYGNISSLPVNESTPLSLPESPYAATKVMGETIVHDAAVYGKSMKAVALRYFNPAGAHSSARLGELPVNKPNNLVPVITRTAIGLLPEFTVFGNDYGTRDGTCIRDYVHVSDIARAHVLALQALENKTVSNVYDVFNLGTGKGVTVLEAIHSFEKVSGIVPGYKIGPRRAGDVEAIYSDCTKAEKTLGWKTQYSLDDMMRSAWEWEQHLAEEKK